MHVALCVVTYMRPDGLRRLLESLNRLTFDGDPPDVTIIIIDNDANGSAGTICAELAPSLRWPLRYNTEPRRGIAHARNRAVVCAGDEIDFLAFIDDDEVPEPTWLDELVRVQRAYDADVVTGPALPYFMEEPPAWIIEGGFFDQCRHRTGDRVGRAATNNVLVRREVFQEMGTPFDKRLALAGGEDTQFFRRVAQAGYRMVWADDAVTYEWVPASRANGRWILQRAFRLGNSDGLIEQDLRRRPVAWGIILVTACSRILKGILFLPLLGAFGRRYFVTYVRHLCYGAGMLAGLAGVRYDEYRRIHGQ